MTLLTGTSGRNAIPTHGGFNKSEFTFQDHKFSTSKSNYNEQDHGHRKYAGRNPLNAPKATTESPVMFRRNEINTWREKVLTTPLPGQVAGGFGKLGGSSDASLLQWRMRHGFSQNDPTLSNLLNERAIAPDVLRGAPSRWQSDPYIHSDILVPSVINQNMMEKPTDTLFPVTQKMIRRGKHDHTNLRYHNSPVFEFDSFLDVGTHYTQGVPLHPVDRGLGVKVTRGPLERPLMLSDLPSAPIPV